MSRISYVNGRYEPHAQAMVSVEDRGYQFADGVYEVIAIWNGYPADLPAHMDRLERSTGELHFASTPHRSALGVIAKQVVRLNRVRNGILYMQVNRGTAARNHVFPGDDIAPSVVVTARTGLGPSDEQAGKGVGLSIQEDVRWGRRDIKSVGLLANALTKQAAKEEGAFESLLVNPDGTVTEASAANVWLVDRDGALVTRPLGPEILAGITRSRVMNLAERAGLVVKENVFTLEDVLAAREVFLTGTTTFVLPVVQVGDSVIANGHPGEKACALRDQYVSYLNSLGPESWHVG